MKPFTRALPLVIGLAFIAAGLSSCATTGPQTPAQVAISGVVDCSKTTIQHDIPNVITDVVTALATTNYIAGLTNIALSVGGDVVACAVKQVRGEAMARYAASGQKAENQGAIAAHAQSYLSGITFAQ